MSTSLGLFSAIEAYISKVQRRQTTGTEKHVEESDREDINGIVLKT